MEALSRSVKLRACTRPIPCGSGVVRSATFRMCETDACGSPSMPTSHWIGSGTAGCGPGGRPRTVALSKIVQVVGTRNAVRVCVSRT